MRGGNREQDLEVGVVVDRFLREKKACLRQQRESTTLTRVCVFVCVVCVCVCVHMCAHICAGALWLRIL